MNKKIAFYSLGLLSVLIGLYPIAYFVVDREFGLLNSKTSETLASIPWNIGFYTHIIFAGVALIIGWSQFSQTLRAKYLRVHRLVGKVYVLSAIISSIAGSYVAIYATGGVGTAIGFMCLAVIWFYTTFKAYYFIKNREVRKHQLMMVYSFSACFAAVTLRLWLPILTSLFGDFETAYKIVAWLCWVPNMVFAFFITRRMKLNSVA